MKNLKISLTAIIFAIILTISTGVFANTGVAEVDPDHKITMPSSLSDGKAVVSGISSYQFVEINEAKYNNIKKIEAQYKLIEILVESNNDPDNENLTQKLNTATQEYKNNYGESATDVFNKYGNGPDILKLCENAWVVALGDFDSSKWVNANNGEISIDLSTFKGTKYYVGWVKSADTYDAEAYKVDGTKKDEQKPENNTPVDNTPKNETPVKKDNTITPKKDNTTVSKTIPHTGANSLVLGLITIAGTVAGISYKKYSKIK